MVNTLNMLMYIKTNNLQKDFPFKPLFPFQCPTHVTSSLCHYVYGFLTWVKSINRTNTSLVGEGWLELKSQDTPHNGVLLTWGLNHRPPIMSVCSSLITTLVGSLLGERLVLLYPIKYISCNKNSKDSNPHARSLYLIDPSLEVTYILLLKKKID